MPEEHPSPLAYGFIKIIPHLVATALIAFAVSWWNLESGRSLESYRLDQIEQKVKGNSDSIHQLADTQNQLASKYSDMIGTQNVVAEQIRQIRVEQEEIKGRFRK